MQSTLTQIREHKIIAIIRGVKPGDILNIVHALYEGGICVLEITLNSQGALKSIQDIESKWGDIITVGAGTVMDCDSAKAAIGVGAKFIISPIVDAETIRVTKRNGIVSIPGAFTPSEIVQAYAHGGDIIKVFPAPSLSYFKNLFGPFQHIPLMPTGGIDLENIGEFKKAGAVAFGIGSALVDAKQEITDEYLNNIKIRAEQFIKAIQ